MSRVRLPPGTPKNNRNCGCFCIRGSPCVLIKTHTASQSNPPAGASLSMQASSLRYCVTTFLSTPPGYTIKTHAKGAYLAPPRVSFSMQNRGKLPFSWQFTLFVVSSLIAVGICSSLALKNLKPLTIAQKGFLHDKERMIFTDLINEKRPTALLRTQSVACL